MDNRCIIQGKELILSEEERILAETFHKGRLAFAYLTDTLVINNNTNDDRDHQHWLLEDYGISREDWEVLNRGYMMQGKIQLFAGSHFKPIIKEYLTDIKFRELLEQYLKRFHTFPVMITNGVVVGKVGDIWNPMEILYKIDKAEAKLILDMGEVDYHV